MKTTLIHIVSIVLLISVGVSCLCDSNFLVEKESYEIEVESVELEEGKHFPFGGFLPNILASNPHGLSYLLPLGSVLGVSSKNELIYSSYHSIGKYLLYCSLKLFPKA